MITFEQEQAALKRSLDFDEDGVTEVVETVTSENIPGHPDIPADDLGPVTATNLFKHPDAHPLALDLAMIKKYTAGWLDWSADTITKNIAPKLGISHVNLDKLLAMKCLHTQEGFWKEWEVFGWLTMALNGITPDWQDIQVPFVADVLVSLDSANKVRHDSD